MSTRTILLIEDNPDDETLTLRALQAADLDAQVVIVRDGAEALDYLFARGPYNRRKAEDLPALILVDLKLPRIDGMEVIRQVRLSPHAQLVPIVVLTTSDEHRDIRESYRLGANSYVRKPVGFARFRESLIQLGQYWLELNESPVQRG